MTRVLPGAVLVRANGRGDVYIGSSRGAQSTLRAGRNRPCPAEIILDGVVMLEGTETQVNTAIQPSEIAAVEWYSGAAEVPQKYNRTKNACAVLVIWTR